MRLLFGVVLLFGGRFLLFGVMFFRSLATCSFCSQKWHLHCSCEETTNGNNCKWKQDSTSRTKH